jgi:hypothetical protein
LSHKFHQRARVGALSRSRADDDPELVDAKRALAAANIAEYIEKIVSQAPPFTREQVDNLRVLLEPARRELVTELTNGGGVDAD